MKFIFAFFIFNILLTWGNGSKILVVFPFTVHSHHTLGLSLAKELAHRGHEVTFINAHPQKKPIKNLKEISVAEIKADIDKGSKEIIWKLGEMSYIGQLKMLYDVSNYTLGTLRVNEVQKLLKSNESFDVVLLEQFFNDAMMIFAHKFKCPLILLAPGPTTIFNNHLFANPSLPSYVPGIMADFSSRMMFWERLRNTYYDVVGELFVHYVMIPKQAEILQLTVAGAPDLENILYNSSLMFLISHSSISDPVPLHPAIKEIGGYHVPPVKPLPKDFQDFLDKATEGVILFTMGSYVKSSDFPRKKKEAILNVFSKLKYKILWKFETDLPEKPDNVRIMSWLPQNDILAHPNVIAFITHVGLLGKTEAIHHGVPILGLPVFYDQEINIEHAVRNGYGLKINFRELNEENFGWALNELTSNPKYRENAKFRSRLMRDQPMKQMDEAVYWIEYVIRHGGAPHLRSVGLDLQWYQRHLIDVLLFLVLISFMLLAISYYIIRMIFQTRNVNKSKIE